MKTTQIEVPHFEGYECLGLTSPSEENFVLRFSESIKEFTLMEGSEDYCHQICYRKIDDPKKDNQVYYLVYFVLEDGETRFDFALFESEEEAEEYAESEMKKDEDIFKPAIVPVSVQSRKGLTPD